MPTSVASTQTEEAQNEQDYDYGADDPDDAIHKFFLPGWRLLRSDGHAVRHV